MEDGDWFCLSSSSTFSPVWLGLGWSGVGIRCYAIMIVSKQPRDGETFMFGIFINNLCCLGAVCVYSPARLLEDSEPRGEEHS